MTSPWRDLRSLENSQSQPTLLQAPFAKITTALFVRTPWLQITKSEQSPPTAPRYRAPASSTHTAPRKAHVMLTQGKCFGTSCPLQRQMKCIVLHSVHSPSYGATPISISLLLPNRDCWAHWSTQRFCDTCWRVASVQNSHHLWLIPDLTQRLRDLCLCFTYHHRALNTREICVSIKVRIKWTFLPTGSDPSDKLYLS